MMQEMRIRINGQIVPERPYTTYQYEMSRKHKIHVGDQVYINYNMPTVDATKLKRILVTVTQVDRFFVTVKFPKGYETSIQWTDFENARVA